MSVVYIERCASYERKKVEATIEFFFTQLDLASKVKKGETVLLKVNLLSPRSPEKAVTTHPEVFRAVAKNFLALGASVQVGDSSGGILPKGNMTSKSLITSGIQKAAHELGVEVINFDLYPSTKRDNPRGEAFEPIYLAQALFDADWVVTLPKLKTHRLTLFTGAVKNMYGSIPGGRKAYYHRIAPTPQLFSQYLVDTFALTKPRLAFMDGIVGMEGDGPAAGDPKALNALLASEDCVALDATACRLIGIDPLNITMLKEAEKRNLGTLNPKVLGPFDELRPESFVARYKELKVPTKLANLFFRFMYTYPFIRPDTCILCALCDRSCPVKAISLKKGHYVVDKKACIQCFCCHELCPKDAIDLKPSSIVRLVQTFKRK